MQQVISSSIFVAGGILAALVATLVMAGTVQLTSRKSHGYLHLIFYAMLLMVALDNIISGRDLTTTALSFSESAGRASTRHPFFVWAQPLVSLLLLTAAAERIVSYWIRRDKTTSAPMVLVITFIVFWISTVALPALLGAHPNITHDYVYSLVIGIAAVLVTGAERDLAFKTARDAVLLFLAAGLFLIPFKPTLVLDLSYDQGLLPGVPRLAGLASHGVSLGVLAQLGLLCLLAFPYRRAWLTRLAWVVGLAALFLAQSKTAWISFAVCSLCLIAVRQGPSFWRRAGDPVRPEFGILSILMFMFAVLAVALLLMFGDVDARLSSFFNSAEGAQLASLTGRDKIWAIAYQEWQRNPVFGYGPLIWEEAFRIAIGMPNATHAHNQFMDTLSRSGTVGAMALLLYSVVLLFMSVRYARASRGLTLALFVVVAMRSGSEVPLGLFGYGTEFVPHVLLLMALAASARDASVRKVPAAADTVAYPFRPRFHPARDPLVNVGLNS
jgi:O-antigen ligase